MLLTLTDEMNPPRPPLPHDESLSNIGPPRPPLPTFSDDPDAEMESVFREQPLESQPIMVRFIA